MGADGAGRLLTAPSTGAPGGASIAVAIRTGVAVKVIDLIRGISAAQFAGIVLLFFLPFVQVSCSGGNFGQGMNVPSFSIDITGQQLATGDSAEHVREKAGLPDTSATPAPGAPPGAQMGPMGPGKGGIDQQISALIAWILAGVGLVISLIAGRAFRAGGVLLGIGGAAMLFWLKSEMASSLRVDMAEAQNFIQVSWEFAFWACVVLFITAAGTNIYSLLRPEQAAQT